jgi:hypothetical protein
MCAPGGWRAMFEPRTVALAVACAVAGALQYLWNLRTLWFTAHPPHGVIDALSTFWFDVTKSDWRDTMVMRVAESTLGDRVAMYWFDLRQQFGLVGPVLAIVGASAMWRRNRSLAILLLLLFVANFAFAFTYNVGDTHVFFLPSHLFIAMFAAIAITTVAQPVRTAVAVAVIGFVAAKAYRDFPALDRRADTRPAQVLEQLTDGIDDSRAILLTDLNWQIANGLSYYAKEMHPEIAHARMPDVLLYAPALIGDNQIIGRSVIVSDRARQEIQAAYGPLVRTSLDRITAPAPLTAELAAVPRGTRYVLAALRPSRDMALNRTDLVAGLRAIAGGREIDLPAADYVAVGGIAGELPKLVAAADAPFRRSVSIGGSDVEIRMEAWLGTDTIRRMGFGHVIVNRQHTLIVERGISFVAFDADGRAIHTAYRANIFAPQPRYLCYR